MQAMLKIRVRERAKTRATAREKVFDKTKVAFSAGVRV